ncbi:PilC/PilY family type IV pilus protein [Oleiagrimonas sp. MCCC 1A03011]|uniref:pilus assembly protein n=1 Tax=Oleiagrimonas sp. MCCC 1A03011 TaxID=1926883 RepID=UPI000DC44A57|nr:PilC/PilY family type IV pilus protein [Oleiagrimonas sp. MCCC 1A03011]RAP56312.1 pilus assembly protein PilY [Oleiagrimonas sp. MCCC 1A03011]
MNTFPSATYKVTRFLRRLFAAGFVVWMLGVPFVTAQAAVPVEQEPLTIQKPLAPNVVLMLDDSGSMAWDYMPDWNYLADTSADGVRYSGVNGTYYNPNVVYSPPPTADGSFYPDSPGLGNAYYDGFRDRSASDEIDVTQYYGSFRYYEHLTATVPTSYDPTLGCHSGDNFATDSAHQGQCAHVSGTSYSYYDPYYYYGTPYCPSGGQLVRTGHGRHRRYQCRIAINTYTYYAPDTKTCPQGGTYDSTQDKCTSTQYASAYLFTYTTPDGSGGYVRHFVGKSQQDCLVAKAKGYDCDYSAAAQQNVANWFSYYHTRILMAKSGLMNAFDGIDPAFRIGFGSINGRNNYNLPADTSTYNNKKIAQVKPFGDGSVGTQRYAFWHWLAGINPSNSTPLRLSLDAVGKYYESAGPWQTSSTDTTELTCRQSYTILTTDGFWNGGSPGLANVDGTDGTSYPIPNSATSYGYKAQPPFSDDQSNTLADVAMKYWKTDLRTSVKNEVPQSDQDKAFWQHMVTFTLGLGFRPTGISPAGTTYDQIKSWADRPDDASLAISGFSWPKASSNSINNIADLEHAGINGHGGFYSAQTPEAFASAVEGALASAGARSGSAASLAANSTELKAGTVTYQAVYETEKWDGDLKAFDLDPITGAVSTSPGWKASDKLPSWSTRSIYTYNASAQKFVAFSDPSTLSSAERTALGSSTTEQQQIINYLRGDASMEESTQSGIYRTRSTPLGDIVDSQPVFVGSPNANEFYNSTFTGSSTFGTYASDKVSRTPIVYVAANDGMLHAFNATSGETNSGKEVYAYLPSAVIKAGIKQLSNPDYGKPALPHQYFNDGELTAADVYFDSTWHTVVVGTTGRGTARAVYALDVTDPSAIKPLWERSANDGNADGNSDYIGQMTGKPVIAQTGNGSWSVIMGNGYNSSKGTAALLQFDIKTGALTVYPVADASTDNGLAAPLVWLDDPSNGISTTAYAGDLRGQVWSFNLAYNGNKVPPGTLLFTAKDSSGNRQPITAGMLAGKDPATNNVWLFFGTGKYLTTSDLTDLSTQTWYGIIVQSADASLVSNLSNGRSSLVQRKITIQTSEDDTTNPPTPATRAVTLTPATSDMGGKSGWYMDLLTPVTGSSTGLQEGERMVTTNQFEGNLLIGTSRIPNGTDPCNPSGTGWINTVNPFTGTNPESSFFDVNGDGKIDDNDKINGKTPVSSIGYSSVTNNPNFVGSHMYNSIDKPGTPIDERLHAGPTGKPARVSWREMTTQ